MKEKDFVDAPMHYSNEEANAWAAGYNSAIADYEKELEEQNTLAQARLDQLLMEARKPCSPTNRHSVRCRCDGRAVVPTHHDGIIPCLCEKCNS